MIYVCDCGLKSLCSGLPCFFLFWVAKGLRVDVCHGIRFLVYMYRLLDLGLIR